MPARGGTGSNSSRRGPGSPTPKCLRFRTLTAPSVRAAGRSGRERLPGKHGTRPTAFASVTVAIPDEPGALARLFADTGDAGVNIEELTLEHAPGRAVGLVDLSVLPAAREDLERALAEHGWQIVG